MTQSAFNVRVASWGVVLTKVNVTESQADLYQLIDDASASHEPVVITGKRGNAVQRTSQIAIEKLFGFLGIV